MNYIVIKGYQEDLWVTKVIFLVNTINSYRDPANNVSLLFKRNQIKEAKKIVHWTVTPDKLLHINHKETLIFPKASRKSYQYLLFVKFWECGEEVLLESL